MITCFIRYDLEPFTQEAFAAYGRMWGQAIPGCGADLIGYFGPAEGSLTTAYGVYTLDSLAAYEAYRARLKASEAGQAAFEFAKREKFIRREDRLFLTNVSAPHAPLVRP
ncbi:MAG: NIPSNAP family protein [Alphaproteobacteria bacterium]|nr:NIPSNAP family protein [Alphaproteobacteria bacterium]TAD87443.1 MAG: NIPSNAP family protein [Alphaproteobacteria bacterium]